MWQDFTTLIPTATLSDSAITVLVLGICLRRQALPERPSFLIERQPVLASEFGAKTSE